MNLLWQHIGWKAVEEGNFKKLYAVDWVYPWISHFLFSFLPTMIITKYGENMVDLMKQYLPMDGYWMKALFTVGALLPCVGIAILLKQIVTEVRDFIPFFVGFTLAKSLGLNLVASAVVSLIFAVIYYELEVIKTMKVVPAGVNDFDDDEEDNLRWAEQKENFKENANQSIPSLVLWSLDLFLSRTHANLWVFDFDASNRGRNV